MGVFLHLQELARFIQLPLGHAAVPGPDGHVGNRVLVTGNETALGQAAIEHVHLPFDFHRKPVDGVFHFERRIGIKMAKTTAQKGRAAHLPKEPGHALGAQSGFGGYKAAKFLGQVQQNCTGLKHPHGRVAAVVDQRGDFGVGIGCDKSAAKLRALVDAHQPGVVFRTAVAQCQQFFQHHRDFDAVGRA